MKVCLLVLSLVLVSITSPAFQMPLDLTSEELQALADKSFKTISTNMTAEEQALENIVAVGKKNLDWIKLISANTPREQEPPSVSLPAPIQDTMRTPTRYGPKSILSDFEKAKNLLPPAMKTVLLSDSPLTTTYPVDKELFLRSSRNIDRVYDRALRWKLYQPFLASLAKRRSLDIRGYHFLKDRPNLVQELKDWKNLSADTQTELKNLLLNICFNSLGSEAGCQQMFEYRLSENDVESFYTEYFAYSGMIYNKFFDIDEIRPEFRWTAKDANKFMAPFRTPSDVKIQEALSLNIQNEWRWQDWSLELEFMPDAPVQAIFEEGVTPHVTRDRDTIFMDSNTPLSEESVKYALRHEFGHILGFPDCYLEFYDEAQREITGYQIDPTDIMCARSGKMKQRHFDALKNAYYRSSPTP